MYGSYFFLSDEMVIQTRSVKTVISALSDLGGSIEIFMIGFLLIGHWYNDFSVMIKSIRAIYFEGDEPDQTKLRPLKLRSSSLLK